MMISWWVESYVKATGFPLYSPTTPCSMSPFCLMVSGLTLNCGVFSILFLCLSIYDIFNMFLINE